MNRLEPVRAGNRFSSKTSGRPLKKSEPCSLRRSIPNNSNTNTDGSSKEMKNGKVCPLQKAHCSTGLMILPTCVNRIFQKSWYRASTVGKHHRSTCAGRVRRFNHYRSHFPGRSHHCQFVRRKISHRTRGSRCGVQQLRLQTRQPRGDDTRITPKAESTSGNCFTSLTRAISL